MRKLRPQAIPGALLILAALSACALLPAEDEPPAPPLLRTYEKTEYVTAEVTIGDIISTQRVTCQFTPAKQETLAFPVSGATIAGIYVAQGDAVADNALLAELDRSAILSQIENQLYSIDLLSLNRKHLIENHRFALERQDIRIAAAEDAAQQAAREIRQALETEHSAKLSALDMQLEAARFKLLELEAQSAARQLFAPFAGTITYMRTTAPGGVSTENEDFITVSDKSTSVFTVGGESAGLFTIGDEIEITISNTTYTAKVVAPEELGAENRVGYAFIRLDEYLPTLKDNAYGSITVILDTRTAVLTLPSSAVKLANGQSIVYYLNADGVRMTKNVETGLSANGRIEITAGLAAGEQVIAE